MLLFVCIFFLSMCLHRLQFQQLINACFTLFIQMDELSHVPISWCAASTIDYRRRDENNIERERGRERERETKFKIKRQAIRIY